MGGLTTFSDIFTNVIFVKCAVGRNGGFDLRQNKAPGIPVFAYWLHSLYANEYAGVAGMVSAMKSASTGQPERTMPLSMKW